MKQYGGAVLFIDMLGIGELTRGRIPLTEVEHTPWNVSVANAGRHQLLGAKLLMQFRQSLVHTRKVWQSVKVAQLSDCAFLWSSDPVAVANAAREVMWHTTRAGLLCRAGLACGQIVEPDKVNQSLGQFILGDAVTSAVSFERSGKGARVFCDREVAHDVLKRCYFKPDPFAPLKNPLDGSIIDEFRWYILPAPIEKHNYEVQKPLQVALGLVELLTTLRYSPRLNWNSCTREGRLQIACTIEAISKLIADYVSSEDYAFTVEHLMEVVEEPKRSNSLQTKIRNQFRGEISQLLMQSKKRKPMRSQDHDGNLEDN